LHSAEGHATLAASLCEFDWDLAAAEAEFRRAIALNPSYPTAHQWYGECMLWVGRIEESKVEFQRARELDRSRRLLPETRDCRSSSHAATMSTWSSAVRP